MLWNSIWMFFIYFNILWHCIIELMLGMFGGVRWVLFPLLDSFWCFFLVLQVFEVRFWWFGFCIFSSSMWDIFSMVVDLSHLYETMALISFWIESVVVGIWEDKFDLILGPATLCTVEIHLIMGRERLIVFVFLKCTDGGMRGF